MADTIVRFRGDASDLNAKLAQVQRGLTGLESRAATANRALGSIQKSAGSVSGALRTAAAALTAFATGSVIQGIVSVTTEMERFRAQLTTYLGDQRLANYELTRLQKLATTLPQDLKDLTQAFTIFTRFGLDTSNKAMTAFANIASANAKSVTQFAEAVADAMTGEFERLKEFGIKVSKENGQFVARVGNDQVALANTTTQLVAQLQKLGEEGGRWGNAAADQALTLGTALSNLRGALYTAADAIGQGGFGAAVAQAARDVTAWIDNNQELVQQISVGLTTAFILLRKALGLVVENIDLVAYAFAAFIGLKIGSAVLGIATAIGSVLVQGIVLAARGIAMLTMVAKRNPILFGAGLLIAGITALSDKLKEWGIDLGAVGEALGDGAKEIADFVGVSDAFNATLEFGREVINKVEGGVMGLAEAYRAARAEAEQYAAKARAANQSMTDAEAEAIKASRERENQRKVEEAANQAYLNTKREIIKALDDETAVLAEQIRLASQGPAVTAAMAKALEAENKAREKNKELTEDQLKAIREEAYAKALGIENSKQQLAVEQAIYDLKRKSTDLEAIQAGSSAFGRMNPAEEMTKTYEKELKGLDILRSRDVIDEEKYLRTKERLNREYANKIFEIQKSEAEEKLRMNGVVNDEIIRMTMSQMDQVKMIQQGGVAGIQGVLGATANIFQQLGGQNEKAFKAYKALAIAQAVISTYQAAAMAIAFPPGPPLSFFYVAGAIAAGMAQVAAIRSQQYSGRQLGGPVMNGQTYMVGENGPELFTPNTNGSITRNGDLASNQPVQVQFQIIANDTTGFDELLYARKGLITQIISDAMLERGQRSVM